MNHSLFIRPIAIVCLALTMALESTIEAQDDQGYTTTPKSSEQHSSQTSVFPPPSSPSPFTQPPVIKDLTPNAQEGVIKLPSQSGHPAELQEHTPKKYPVQDDGLEAIIQSQLSDLRDQDISKAYYAYMSSDFQKAYNVDVFKAFIRKSPTLFRNKSFTVDSTNFNDVIATVKGKIVSTDDLSARIVYDLIQEDGVWKIRKIDLTPIAQPPPAYKKLSRPQPRI